MSSQILSFLQQKQAYRNHAAIWLLQVLWYSRYFFSWACHSFCSFFSCPLLISLPSLSWVGIPCKNETNYVCDLIIVVVKITKSIFTKVLGDRNINRFTWLDWNSCWTLMNSTYKTKHNFWSQLLLPQLWRKRSPSRKKDPFSSLLRKDQVALKIFIWMCVLFSI